MRLGGGASESYGAERVEMTLVSFCSLRPARCRWGVRVEDGVDIEGGCMRLRLNSLVSVFLLLSRWSQGR